eukprot:3418435-Alexandrium_andersonii.AAC.1
MRRLKGKLVRAERKVRAQKEKVRAVQGRAEKFFLGRNVEPVSQILRLARRKAREEAELRN